MQITRTDEQSESSASTFFFIAKLTSVSLWNPYEYVRRAFHEQITVFKLS